jgi:hypothetical protein
VSAQRYAYTLDAELRFVGVGKTTATMWGRRERDLLGRRIVDVFPAMEGGVVHQALMEALRTMRPVRVEAMSLMWGVPMRVEIYPVHGGLQVGLERLGT